MSLRRPALTINDALFCFRWASDAFLRYLKLGRSTRISQQMKLAEEVAMVAKSEIEENVAFKRAIRRQN